MLETSNNICGKDPVPEENSVLKDPVPEEDSVLNVRFYRDSGGERERRGSMRAESVRANEYWRQDVQRLLSLTNENKQDAGIAYLPGEGLNAMLKYMNEHPSQVHKKVFKGSTQVTVTMPRSDLKEILEAA